MGPEVAGAHSQGHRGASRVVLTVCAGPNSSQSQTPEPPRSHRGHHSSRCGTECPREVRGTPQSSESAQNFE